MILQASTRAPLSIAAISKAAGPTSRNACRSMTGIFCIAISLNHGCPSAVLTEHVMLLRNTPNAHARQGCAHRHTVFSRLRYEAFKLINHLKVNFALPAVAPINPLLRRESDCCQATNVLSTIPLQVFFNYQDATGRQRLQQLGKVGAQRSET